MFTLQSTRFGSFRIVTTFEISKTHNVTRCVNCNYLGISKKLSAHVISISTQLWSMCRMRSVEWYRKLKICFCCGLCCYAALHIECCASWLYGLDRAILVSSETHWEEKKNSVGVLYPVVRRWIKNVVLCVSEEVGLNIVFFDHYFSSKYINLKIWKK